MWSRVGDQWPTTAICEVLLVELVCLGKDGIGTTGLFLTNKGVMLPYF